MNQPWKLKLNLMPVAKGRPRAFRMGTGVRMFTPAKTKDFETEAANLVFNTLQSYGIGAWEDAVSVIVRFYLPKPKSAKKRKYPDVKPDVDNFGKAVLDAVNEIAFKDDKQIVDLMQGERYVASSQSPEIHITLLSPSSMSEVWKLIDRIEREECMILTPI